MIKVKMNFDVDMGNVMAYAQIKIEEDYDFHLKERVREAVEAVLNGTHEAVYGPKKEEK